MQINQKSIALSAIAGFLYVFALDWVYHCVLLKNAYLATAPLWRTPEEMRILTPYAVLGQLIFATVSAYIFVHGYTKKGMEEGVKFGFYLGSLLSALYFMCYAFMPVPLNIVLAWIAAGYLKALGLGIIFVKAQPKA